MGIIVSHHAYAASVVFLNLIRTRPNSGNSSGCLLGDGKTTGLLNLSFCPNKQTTHYSCYCCNSLFNKQILERIIIFIYCL